MAKTIEDFFAQHTDWNAHLIQLRDLLVASELTETIKWGMPVYCLDGKHVVGLAAFKDYAGLWFYQGALLTDERGLLINAQEGKTVAQRQWRFGREDEIPVRLVSEYISQAIENQRNGATVPPAAEEGWQLPQLLQQSLNHNSALSLAFCALSHYKQKEYAQYIDSAKRVETKRQRLTKIIPMILKGAGLNDKYRNG